MKKKQKKQFLDFANNFALIDFLANASANLVLKKSLAFVRFMFIAFGILVLFSLSVAPFLRDISTVSNICYEKRLSTLESTQKQNLAKDSLQNPADDFTQGTQETQTYFLREAAIFFDSSAQQIDSIFEDYLGLASPFIATYFGGFFIDSSEVDFDIDDFASSQTSQNLQNLITQKLVYNYMQISQPTYDTLYMVSISTLIAVIFGLPLGVLLCLTKKGRIFSCQSLNTIIGSVVNIIRSFPFIILIILLLPLSRLIVGTSIGASAAIIPLSIAAIPFIARLFEGGLDEVDKGLIEASLSLGASKLGVIKMMIAEALPSICNAIVITIIGLIGYSAMGGAVGAGGLGDTAIRLGFQGYQPDILFSTVIVIIILVQCVQGIGDSLVARLRKYR